MWELAEDPREYSNPQDKHLIHRKTWGWWGVGEDTFVCWSDCWSGVCSAQCSVAGSGALEWKYCKDVAWARGRVSASPGDQCRTGALVYKYLHEALWGMAADQHRGTGLCGKTLFVANNLLFSPPPFMDMGQCMYWLGLTQLKGQCQWNSCLF